MTTPLKAVAAGGNSAELREWVAGDFLPVANGGTGATTAATARSNLGLGSAAVAAIVGTVSQSGGVPTGAILQRGSNANGEFLRLADGTQICRKTVSVSVTWTLVGQLYVSGDVAIGSWAAAFSTLDGVSYAILGGSAGSIVLSGVAYAGASGAGNVYLGNNTNVGAGTMTVNAIGTGRWF